MAKQSKVKEYDYLKDAPIIPNDQEKQLQTPEQFLNSKGIDPPIKEAPLQGITFIQLCELMTEFKNA
jgi:hypothetical protein